MTDRTNEVLELFGQISAVPRKSGNRGPIRDWITSWSETQGFETLVDGYDNVLIKVPATPGFEDRSPVVLQGHSDMVCEKTPDSDHDFASDPLDIHTDGEWLRARNTTLGADNGIAVAIALDMAVNGGVKHPPLEILITSDEEIGLDGANALEPGFLSGRRLINIDSEDEGIFTVGCAGGMDCLFDFEGEWEPAEGVLFEVVIDGLAGGHSGMDINKGRGSAVVMMGRLLSELLSGDIRLSGMESGSGATNAISRRAWAVIAVSGVAESALSEKLDLWQDIFRHELGEGDPQIRIELHRSEIRPDKCLTSCSAVRFTDLLMAMPHGVMALSREIDGLVETSSNLASVKREGEGFRVYTSQRSSVMSRLKEVNRRVESAARLAGCVNISTKNKYPAWQPDWDSPLLAESKEVYRRLFGKDPVVEVIHAGLETGVIGSKYEGMDMISLGPTIKNPHSPDEKMHIPSLGKIYFLISELLAEL